MVCGKIIDLKLNKTKYIIVQLATLLVIMFPLITNSLNILTTIFFYNLITILLPFKRLISMAILLAMIISLLILINELFWGKLGRNLIRELLFDTSWEIQANRKFKVQQILGGFFKQNRDINLLNPSKIWKYLPGKLLTKAEKQWLRQEIEQFWQ